MKPSLSTIAIILSVIAVVISLSQPTYNFLITMSKTENGTPSFSIGTADFYVFYTYTRITLINNGTATAHDVGLNLVFTNPPSQNWQATEFVSEIGAGQLVVFEIPIGSYQLSSTLSIFSNASDYQAFAGVTCKELGPTASFQFQHFIA